MPEIFTETQELGLEVLKLHMKQIVIQEQLDKKKEELRRIAEGETLRIEVGDHGSILITEPRGRSSKTVLTINEEKLNKTPDLRNMLLSKKILKEETKVIPAARAAVKISPKTIFASPPEV